jgi:hypothetical protein
MEHSSETRSAPPKPRSGYARLGARIHTPIPTYPSSARERDTRAGSGPPPLRSVLEHTGRTAAEEARWVLERVRGGEEGARWLTPELGDASWVAQDLVKMARILLQRLDDGLEGFLDGFDPPQVRIALYVVLEYIAVKTHAPKRHKVPFCAFQEKTLLAKTDFERMERQVLLAVWTSRFRERERELELGRERR